MALTDKLTAIADAIRGKTGGTEELTLDRMAVEIAGISGGGSGGSLDWEFINSITLSEEISSSTVEITTDANGNPFAYKELFVIVSGQAPAGKSNVITWIPNSSWGTGEVSNSIIKLPEFEIILTAQAVIMDLPDGTHFLHQYEPYRPYAIPLNNAPISIISNKAIWQSFIKYKWLGTFAAGTQFILYGRNKV